MLSRREGKLLSGEMCEEIDRLGLDRVWFQRLLNAEGIELTRFA